MLFKKWLIRNNFYLRNKGAIGICCKSGSMMLRLSLRLSNHREDKKGSKDLKKMKKIYIDEKEATSS